MAPIMECMKVGRFSWSDELITAFKVIKVTMTIAPLLVLLDFIQSFELHCDASKVRIGAVLSQGGKHVVYFSEKLSWSKLNYSTYDVEFSA